eukprot:1960122-Pyramimonas_sp.AAC.1
MHTMIHTYVPTPTHLPTYIPTYVRTYVHSCRKQVFILYTLSQACPHVRWAPPGAHQCSMAMLSYDKYCTVALIEARVLRSSTQHTGGVAGVDRVPRQCDTTALRLVSRAHRASGA